MAAPLSACARTGGPPKKKSTPLAKGITVYGVEYVPIKAVLDRGALGAQNTNVLSP